MTPSPPDEREAIVTAPEFRWRVKYSYTGSPNAWFEYVGTWQDLTDMMGENLWGVRKMKIKCFGQTDHISEQGEG